MIPMFSIKAVLLVALVAFASGSIAGAKVMWSWWGVANMKAEIAARREAERRLTKALQLNEITDDETKTIEAKNEEILDAVLRRSKPSPVITLNPSCPADPVCVSADSMRDIGKLQ